MIFTGGNHQSASRGWLGNSWIRVGSGADEHEYNNITGISWDRVRHQSGTVFTTSFFDGSSKSMRWLTLNSFSSNYGLWVNVY
jgi:hypothetical protein